MANANHSTTDNPAPPPLPKWPSEPEKLLQFAPDYLEGSPADMLTCTLMRTHGIVSLLLAEFLGGGSYRPDDLVIANALCATQGHLNLAQQLLDVLEES